MDVDDLTPTEYLVGEVLAARHRLGEHRWPFPNKVRPALRTLAAKGLIGFQGDIMPGAQTAWLTIDGEHLFLYLEHVPGRDRDPAT